MTVRSGDDVDRVAAGEFGLEGNRIAVDLAGNRFVSDIGMDGVCEIYGRRAAGQGNDLAFWCEHVNGVREQIDFDILDEFSGITGLALDVKQRTQRFAGTRLDVAERLGVRFIEPVRGDSLFGDAVHIVRADLELDRRAKWANQCRMQ